jgi:hypothetical protein
MRRYNGRLNTFSRLAAARDVTIMEDTVATRGLLVTGNYFEMLGAQPAIGRLLRSDDAVARGGWRSSCSRTRPGALGTARIQP